MGNPFGPMPHLLAIADQVVKVHAICTVCGAPASKTYRKEESRNKEQVLVGEAEVYEARCRAHVEYFEEVAAFENIQAVDNGASADSVVQN